ncbi:hypothetical protein IWW48_005777 [Coemansia sp. RSA 1200]|nr:hypothetical protein IWW48_005777 [Coemansia sp. RSA 1200]
MSLICSISGETPSEPVVSAKTGTVYDRRLLEKYTAEHNGREPQTDHVLSEDEIIAVRTDPPAVRPRPPTLTSIPALLSTFQNEWDALVLETFTLKQQHTQVRQELAQALYQNDAACRVIARLMRERDEARQALATLQAQVPATTAAATATGSDTQGGSGSGAQQEAPPAGDRGTTMDVDGADEPPRSAEEKYYATAAETAKRLSAVRMKREAPAGLASAEAWKTARLAGVVESLHTSTKPGITTLQTDGSGDLALTGAMDNHAEVYSRSRDLTVATLKGHTKKLTAAVWAAKSGDLGAGFGARIITGSADKSVRVWAPKPGNAQVAEGAEEALDLRAVGWTKLCVIKEHAAEIAGITVHPSGEYFATAAVDGSWAIHTIDGDTIVSETLDTPLTAIAYHPDGMFLGIGTAAGQVKVLDVKQRQVLATLDASPDSSSAVDPTPVRGLHFSENGYYFATTCDHEVAIWDLRKQKKSRSWTCADLQETPDSPFAAPARFDGSGKYLAIVHGRTLHVFKVKGWQLLASVEMASASASAAAAADGSSDPKTHSTLADDVVEDIDWIGSLSSTVAGVTKLNSLIYFAPSERYQLSVDKGRELVELFCGVREAFAAAVNVHIFGQDVDVTLPMVVSSIIGIDMILLYASLFNTADAPQIKSKPTSYIVKSPLFGREPAPYNMVYKSIIDKKHTLHETSAGLVVVRRLVNTNPKDDLLDYSIPKSVNVDSFINVGNAGIAVMVVAFLSITVRYRRTRRRNHEPQYVSLFDELLKTAGNDTTNNNTGVGIPPNYVDILNFLNGNVNPIPEMTTAMQSEIQSGNVIIEQNIPTLLDCDKTHSNMSSRVASPNNLRRNRKPAYLKGKYAKIRIVRNPPRLGKGLEKTD